MEINHAPAFWLENSLFTLIATKEQTGGSYSLLHQRLQRGSKPAPHSHAQEEALYVLEGEVTLIAGQERFTATAGSFVYIPEGTIHTFRVESAEAQLLDWHLPGGFERTITELAAPAEAHTLPPAGVASRGSSEQAEALFQQVGMTRVALPDSLRQD